MGEPRGKLEALIAELEAKRLEALKVIQEYDLLLPHLQEGIKKLDDAGITESLAPQPAAAAAPAAPSPKIQEVKPKEQEEEPEVEKPAAKETKKAKEKEPEPGPEPEEQQEEAAAAGPARRSIASLVADDAKEATG